VLAPRGEFCFMFYVSLCYDLVFITDRSWVL